MPPNREMPWRRVLLEAAVIVGSILLAFGIDAWWDRASNEAAFEQQLALLATQMRANDGLLEGDVSLAEQGRDGLVALIREISLSPAPLSFDSIFELVGPGLVFNGRALETTALETVLSSGHVDIVADSTLHQSLVRFRGLDVLRAGDLDRFVDVRERVYDRLYDVAPLARQYMPSVASDYPISPTTLLSDFALQGLLAELMVRHAVRIQRSEETRELVARILTEIESAGVQ